MPGHWGGSSSSGSRGSPHSGGGGGGGGGWSPGVGGQQHQPKTKTSTWTPGGGAPTHIPKKKTSTWTPGGGAPTHIPKKKTPPVTAGLGHPAFKNRGIKKKIAEGRWNRGPYGIGYALQALTNMPKYWSLPSDIRALIESGEDIPFAHGFKNKKAMEAAKEFGFDASRFKKVPTTSELEKFLSTGNWKKLKEAEGVFGATGKDALKSAAQYAKGPGFWNTRGVGKAGDLTQVLSGKVPSTMGYVDRGLLGNIQTRLPSGVVNKALNLGPASAQVGGKPITQSMLNKLGARAMPGANIALGGASALGHLQKGNYGQAAMAGLSMIPGPVGYVGLGGEMLLGGLQKYRKNQGPDTNTGLTEFAAANGGLINLYRYGGFSG